MVLHTETVYFPPSETVSLPVVLGDLEQVVEGEVLIRGVAPELLAHLEVDELRERLGQAVRHRVKQDRLVHLCPPQELRKCEWTSEKSGSECLLDAIWTNESVGL